MTGTKRNLHLVYVLYVTAAVLMHGLSPLVVATTDKVR